MEQLGKTTIYAIIVSRDFTLIFETGLELAFCLAILILEIKYRNNWKQKED